MIKAPSTHTQVSGNFFFPDSKISVHTLRIQMQLACPHASDGIWIHSRETWPTRCATIFIVQ